MVADQPNKHVARCTANGDRWPPFRSSGGQDLNLRLPRYEPGELAVGELVVRTGRARTSAGRHRHVHRSCGNARR